MYVPLSLLSAYFNGVYKSCSNNAGGISNIVNIEHFPMKLDRFYLDRNEGHSTHTFRKVYFDNNQDGFIVSLPTVIRSDLNMVGQSNVIYKYWLDPVLSIREFRRVSKIDWEKYIVRQNLFLG